VREKERGGRDGGGVRRGREVEREEKKRDR